MSSTSSRCLRSIFLDLHLQSPIYPLPTYLLCTSLERYSLFGFVFRILPQNPYVLSLEEAVKSEWRHNYFYLHIHHTIDREDRNVIGAVKRKRREILIIIKELDGAQGDFFRWRRRVWLLDALHAIATLGQKASPCEVLPARRTAPSPPVSKQSLLADLILGCLYCY